MADKMKLKIGMVDEIAAEWWSRDIEVEVEDIVDNDIVKTIDNYFRREDFIEYNRGREVQILDENEYREWKLAKTHKVTVDTNDITVLEYRGGRNELSLVVLPLTETSEPEERAAMLVWDIIDGTAARKEELK